MTSQDTKLASKGGSVNTPDTEMMKLAETIETHETWLDYYLGAWESATDKGSQMSADRSLDTAAKHATIISALKSRISGDGL